MWGADQAEGEDWDEAMRTLLGTLEQEGEGRADGSGMAWSWELGTTA